MSKFTDSERLEWLIQSGARVTPYAHGFAVRLKGSCLPDLLRDTPREAIDAAMIGNMVTANGDVREDES